MAGERFMTTDHGRIRKWVEERGGTPATVSSTRSHGDAGIICVDFPGHSEEGSLERIGWDEWFRKFDETNLVLVYEESLSDGAPSNFNKLINRSAAEENEAATWKNGS